MATATLGRGEHALRAASGFASLLIALALGVYMLARGLFIYRAELDADPAAAFAFSAGIKPGHAATMHDVLVLPGLAWPGSCRSHRSPNRSGCRSSAAR